jgi:hypothetical protein
MVGGWVGGNELLAREREEGGRCGREVVVERTFDREVKVNLAAGETERSGEGGGGEVVSAVR